VTHDQLIAALENWGRWSRTGDPYHMESGEDAPCAISHIYELGPDGWDDGWGERGMPDAIPDPIDILAAERLDDQIIKLAMRHWWALKRAYCMRQYGSVLYEVRQAAERALMDRVAKPQHVGSRRKIAA
jgi:hypothetical protein